MGQRLSLLTWRILRCCLLAVHAAAQQKVLAFYTEQHAKMTYAFVEQMEAKYLGLTHFRLGIWEALQFLDTFVDDSDPDTENSQIQHALQTAEAIRAQYPGEEYDWSVDVQCSLRLQPCLSARFSWFQLGLDAHFLLPVSSAWLLRFHLTGLIHDLGKILAIACKEPQW